MAKSGLLVSRKIAAIVVTLFAVFATMNFILWPKDSAYWRLHIWVGQVSFMFLAWLFAVSLYSKTAKHWGTHLLGLTILCGLGLIAGAYALQWLR